MEKLPKLLLSFVLYLVVNLSVCCQSTTKDRDSYIDEAFKKYPQTSQEFRDYMQSAISIYPNDAKLHREIATSYFKSGEYGPAMRYINKAVDLDPRTWLEYRAFMKCIFMKDYEPAIADFKKAISLGHSGYVMDHSYQFYLGVSYLKINQLDSANRYMEHSVNIRLPKGKNWVHYVDWFYWGLIKHKQKDYAKALEYYDNALDQYSSFPDALYYKALVLKNQNRKEEAHKLLLVVEKSLLNGYRLNEANEGYVNYPFQISTPEVQTALKEIE